MFKYFLFWLRTKLRIKFKPRCVTEEEAVSDPKWTVIRGDYHVYKNYQYLNKLYIIGSLQIHGHHVAVNNCIIKRGIHA